MTLPIAVLVSGSGSNLQALIDHIEAGRIDARITAVVSNKAEAQALARARNHGLATVTLPHGDFPDRAAFDAALLGAVRGSGAEAVVLAGFMRILGADFVTAYRQRILNIHPALLPSFPGIRGAADAAAYGVTVAGATVHFVDEKMDNGPIVIQAAVPARPGDDGASLGARILAFEHRIYPQAVAWLAAGRLSIDGRKTRLAPAGLPLADLAEAGPCLVSPPLESGF
ncbi:phosphoribosylglycinamide formyltransferase [Solidesulfovibrio sp.]|uniref:phosphoribosylglycinamide formyltransferase n=1 Tax=Solidesulfovibrio sp. TaxID=2910990 RepID=UPI002B2190B0|nr:phosphoribosylglycinamide formyltransferase [Solidesulfovibrio sp.]MEA4858592.1 phosphoribosylglycinamide formyltransferase [Solidesulfovibrio sp.]